MDRHDLRDIYFDRVEGCREKQAYTKAVLDKLPQWFGNRQALEEYADKSSLLPYWSAFDKGGRCVGFLAVKIHYEYTGDIFVCGVLPEYHRKGIGKTLYTMAERYLIERGCKYVIVKTLSGTVQNEPYSRTRKFYEKVGFRPLITLTEMWDAQNPCLIMIKPL